ncbi:MAG: dCMP deaminase family protein [Patescibacteria group bacterium]|jgi:dCMP deaminase
MAKDKKYQRNHRLSWDEFFMTIAVAAAERTACIFHKVGSVFVDENHRVISLGYNGPTAGDIHCIDEGCAKVHGDPDTNEIQRCRGAHSEINAIINSGNTERLKGSTLYITLFPCYDCLKALNNLGIKKIIYLDEYLRVKEGSDGSKKESEPEARRLANKRGIICEKFRGKIKINSEYFDMTPEVELIKEELRF